MTRRDRKSCGFTAVELLAATALAGILMVAVLAVIASIGRSRATVERHDKPNPWLSDIEPLVRQDLLDARTIDNRNQVLLQGYNEIDPVTLARTHRPAEIRYFVTQVGSSSVLLRQQRTLDSVTGAHIFTQVVALDVASITLKDLVEHRRVQLIVQPSTAAGPGLDRIVLLE